MPVRKQHRSRTPRTKALEAGPTTPALEDKPASRTPSLAHPGTPLHGSQPGQAEATASAMQPRTTASEVIDIESLPDNLLTQVAPSTPPELGGKRSSSEMTQPLPEQPSAYRALIAKHTRQLQIDDNGYHLQGYQKIARTSGNLKVWARRDIASHALQTTHYAGPPKNRIRHRRVLTTHTAPSSGTSPMTMRMTTRSSAEDHITELWYEPQHPAHISSLEVTPDGIQLKQNHSDGSEHVAFPWPQKRAFRAYRASGLHGHR